MFRNSKQQYHKEKNNSIELNNIILNLYDELEKLKKEIITQQNTISCIENKSEMELSKHKSKTESYEYEILNLILSLNSVQAQNQEDTESINILTAQLNNLQISLQNILDGYYSNSSIESNFAKSNNTNQIETNYINIEDNLLLNNDIKHESIIKENNHFYKKDNKILDEIKKINNDYDDDTLFIKINIIFDKCNLNDYSDYKKEFKLSQELISNIHKIILEQKNYKGSSEKSLETTNSNYELILQDLNCKTSIIDLNVIELNKLQEINLNLHNNVKNYKNETEELYLVIKEYENKISNMFDYQKEVSKIKLESDEKQKRIIEILKKRITRICNQKSKMNDTELKRLEKYKNIMKDFDFKDNENNFEMDQLSDQDSVNNSFNSLVIDSITFLDKNLGINNNSQKLYFDKIQRENQILNSELANQKEKYIELVEKLNKTLNENLKLKNRYHNLQKNKIN